MKKLQKTKLAIEGPNISWLLRSQDNICAQLSIRSARKSKRIPWLMGGTITALGGDAAILPKGLTKQCHSGRESFSSAGRQNRINNDVCLSLLKKRTLALCGIGGLYTESQHVPCMRVKSMAPQISKHNAPCRVL